MRTHASTLYRWAMSAFALALALVLMPVPCLAHSVALGGFDADASSGSPENGTGYIPSDELIVSVHEDGLEQEPILLGSEALPELWPPAECLDENHIPASVPWLTTAKSQNPFNTCWAFSTIACLETSALRNNVLADVTADTLNLSERHLAYFTYNRQADPLGGTRGDSYVITDIRTYLSRGGNFATAAHTLGNWLGAVPEEVEDPNNEGAYLVPSYEQLVRTFEIDPDAANLDPLAAYDFDCLHMSQALRIAMVDDQDVKQAIIDNGAVAVPMASISAEYKEYYNADSHAYHCDKSNPTASHAVVIVGWDDEYSPDNFNEAHRPAAKGAWLARNSWGAGWGDQGYFWISYEDACVSKQNAYCFVAMDAQDEDNIYQHDGTSAEFFNYLCSGGSVANVYQACGNADGAERLERVSIALRSTNVSYRVQVYTDLQQDGDPTSGTPQLGEGQEGFFTYGGYNTVELDQPVLLNEGESFSVVITLTNMGEGLTNESAQEKGYTSYDNLIGYEVDCSRQYATLSVVNAVEPGESFEQDCEGAAWNDLSADAVVDPETGYDYGDEVQCTSRIKAYTVNVEAPLPEWERLAGDTRYDTMARIVAEGFGDGSAQTVVLATGDNFPDALVASSLAGSLGCPVILTSRSALSGQAASELLRLGASQVLVMGGAAAVSDEVVSEIEGMGISCTRVYGATRQQTSLEAMKRLSGYDTVVVATGDNFADALAIGPWCYHTGSPILLASRGALSAAQYDAVAKSGAAKVVIVGGEAAVSVETQRALESMGLSVTRLGGATRYDTSVDIANWALGQGMTVTHVAVATGENFPDALAGAALCGSKESVLVLMSPANTEVVEGVLFGSRLGEVGLGYVLGGEVVVDATAFTYLCELTR